MTVAATSHGTTAAATLQEATQQQFTVGVAVARRFHGGPSNNGDDGGSNGSGAKLRGGKEAIRGADKK